MANIGFVTQSIVELLALDEGTASVTQSIIEYLTNVGITCGNPPAGQIGVAYSHTFPSGGGEAPLTFSIIAGSLPPGLTLAAATGILSGVPTGSGTFGFTIQVVDSLGATNSVSCSITVPTSIIIQLIGWKLYPNPPCDTLPTSVPELPSVKRAV